MAAIFAMARFNRDRGGAWAPWLPSPDPQLEINNENSIDMRGVIFQQVNPFHIFAKFNFLSTMCNKYKEYMN